MTRFAMQIVGAPVGRDVGAMSPDGADFLSADGLPDVLAVLDDGAGKQHLAVGGDDLGRDGRGVVHDLYANSAQNAKRNNQYKCECNPQFLVGHRGRALFLFYIGLRYRVRIMTLPDHKCNLFYRAVVSAFSSMAMERGKRMLFSR